MGKPVTDIDRAFARLDLKDAEVARAIGVTRQCVRYWRHGRNLISPARARELNARFGLPLHILRPDVWDPPLRACRRKAA
jgi:plasmid maintenance system antidote protein VapI